MSDVRAQIAAVAKASAILGIPPAQVYARTQSLNPSLLGGLSGMAPQQLQGIFSDPEQLKAYTTPVNRGDRASVLKSKLVARGLPDHIAEGFVINFQDESGFKANAIEGAPNVHGTRGFGLYQLTDTAPGKGRRSEYEQFAARRQRHPSDEDTQLDFLVHELQNKEAGAWKRISRSTNSREAAAEIVTSFLRPAKQHEQSRRAKYLSGQLPTFSNPQAQAAPGIQGDASVLLQRLQSRAVGGGQRPDTFTGLQAPFVLAVDKMISDMPAELSVKINSGYRSYEKQKEIFDQAVKKHGSVAAARKWAAPPGKSRHNLGNAIDLQYGSDAARAWVHANSKRYGLQFPLSNESWHIEPLNARTSNQRTPTLGEMMGLKPGDAGFVQPAAGVMSAQAPVQMQAPMTPFQQEAGPSAPMAYETPQQPYQPEPYRPAPIMMDPVSVTPFEVATSEQRRQEPSIVQEMSGQMPQIGTPPAFEIDDELMAAALPTFMNSDNDDSEFRAKVKAQDDEIINRRRALLGAGTVQELLF